jgi:hypothetical protein
MNKSNFDSSKKPNILLLSSIGFKVYSLGIKVIFLT